MLLTQSSHIHLLQDLNSLFRLTSSFVFPAPLDCSAQPTNMMQSLPATLLPHIQIFLALYFGLPSKPLKREAPLPASLLVIYPGSCLPLSQSHKIVPQSSLFWDPILPDPSQLVISCYSLLVVPRPHITLPSPCPLLRPWFQPMLHLRAIVQLL